MHSLSWRSTVDQEVLTNSHEKVELLVGSTKVNRSTNYHYLLIQSSQLNCKASLTATFLLKTPKNRTDDLHRTPYRSATDYR